MRNDGAAVATAPVRPTAKGISPLRTVALCLFLVIILWMLLLGVRYGSASQFMPYHREAVGMAWESVPTNFKVLLLGLINLVGVTLLCLACLLAATLWLAFRRGAYWADWAISGTLLLFTAGGSWITHRVAAQTGAHTPWRTLVSLFVLSLAGAFLCMLDRVRRGGHQRQ